MAYFQDIIDNAIRAIKEEEASDLPNYHTVRTNCCEIKQAYKDWICAYNVDEEPIRPPTASDLYDKIKDTAAANYITLPVLEVGESRILDENDSNTIEKVLANESYKRLCEEKGIGSEEVEKIRKKIRGEIPDSVDEDVC